MMNIKWYVLYVNTGQEHAVAEQLRHRGYDAIVPIENKLIRSKGKWITQPFSQMIRHRKNKPRFCCRCRESNTR